MQLGENNGITLCIIANILNSNKNLLVIEKKTDNFIKENRNINNLNFYIENIVNTISWQNLQNK